MSICTADGPIAMAYSAAIRWAHAAENRRYTHPQWAALKAMGASASAAPHHGVAVLCASNGPLGMTPIALLHCHRSPERPPWSRGVILDRLPVRRQSRGPGVLGREDIALDPTWKRGHTDVGVAFDLALVEEVRYRSSTVLDDWREGGLYLLASSRIGNLKTLT